MTEVPSFSPEAFDPLIRQRLEDLFRSNDFDEIGRTVRIRVIQDAEEMEPEVDCAAYVLKLRGKELIRKMLEVLTYEEVEKPNNGDIVLYFNKEGDWAHIGILGENEQVISKWNDGHVYEHPPLLVPTNFGDEIRIVRMPMSESW